MGPGRSLSLNLGARRFCFLPLPVAALRLSLRALAVGLFVCAGDWRAPRTGTAATRDRNISGPRALSPRDSRETINSVARPSGARATRKSEAEDQAESKGPS